MDRQELRRLAEKATPGPWAYDFVGEKSNDWCVGQAVDQNDKLIEGEVPDSKDFVVIEHVAEMTDGNLSDARYIAAANPNTVIALLDETDSLSSQVQSLNLEVERLREAVEKAESSLLCASLQCPQDDDVGREFAEHLANMASQISQARVGETVCEVCPRCNGSKIVGGNLSLETCPECQGDSQVRGAEPFREGDGR